MSRFTTLALDTLLATTEDAAAALDAELRLVLANDAMRALFRALTGRELTLGSTLDERWDEPGRARFRPLYERAFAGEQVEVELEVALAGGEEAKALRIRLCPIRGRKAVEGVLSLVRDVTAERAAAEVARRAAQAVECRARLDAASRLAGGIAHDFNNLLTVIYATAASELEEAHPSDPVTRSLRDIAAACESARKITRELSALAGSQRIDAAPTELGALLTRIRGVLARLAGPGVELVVGASPGPMVSIIDGPQLERVLVNLVKNAREADARRVELTLERVGDRVELRVRDDGHGIAPDVLPRIFEPFFTTKGDAPSLSGSGLGLASSHGVVRALGGELTVESTPGRGSTFCVSLPAAEVQAPDEGDGPPVLAPSTTVLVLDDDPALRSLAGVLLRRSGFRVVAAANADEASRHVRAEPVDVLLADVVLPGASGPAVASALRRERPGLRTLFMSGYPAEALRPHGLDPSGAFIAKPFTRSALEAAVREARARSES